MGYIYLFGGITNLFLFLVGPVLVGFFNISVEARDVDGDHPPLRNTCRGILAALLQPAERSPRRGRRPDDDDHINILYVGLPNRIFLSALRIL